MPRYSKRLFWSQPVNELARLLAGKKEAHEPILDLTVSNPTTVLAYPHEGIQSALAKAGRYSYQPEAFGLPSARAAIEEFYRTQNIGTDPSRIALTASTSEAYSLLFKLLCDPGDEVLIPIPSYPLFDYLAALESVRTVPYRLEYDGSWFIDFDHLQRQLSPRTRAIIVVNPNNPTGSYLKQQEWERLVDLGLAYRLPLIADEVFMSYEFGSEPSRVKTCVDDDRVLSFSLNGLSKAAGMPQMKLAWMVINGPSDERAEVRERLEILLDTYLSVGTPVQLAVEELLELGATIRHDLLVRAIDNLRFAHAMSRTSPVHTLHTEGGWSVIVQIPATRSEEQWLTELLDKRNVLLQPGFFFDMHSEAFGVLSLITETAIFREGLQRVQEFVISHS